MNTKKKLNRLWNFLYAFLYGYFWLPCPICGEKFGGHEYGETLMTSINRGLGVCPNCGEETKRRNEKFMKNHKEEIKESIMYEIGGNK